MARVPESGRRASAVLNPGTGVGTRHSCRGAGIVPCPAAGGGPSGQRAVRMRGPESVMATVCSACAAREPSFVRSVQPSGAAW